MLILILLKVKDLKYDNNKFLRIIKNGFDENIKIKSEIINSNLFNKISDTTSSVINCLKKGGKIIFAGNGGSFADSQHLAAEFISKFLMNREPIPALALGTNSSIMSSIGNDFKYDYSFSRELIALGSPKDIFIPISTSGNSKNIVNAVKIAKDLGIKTIALTGKTGGKLNLLCECIKVPSNSVPRIQECHILIGHLICEITENEIFENR